MALVYQVTREELRRYHRRKVREVVLNRLGFLFWPPRWRWFRCRVLRRMVEPPPPLRWYTWDALVSMARRHGVLVAVTERGQDVLLKLTDPVTHEPASLLPDGNRVLVDEAEKFDEEQLLRLSRGLCSQCAGPLGVVVVPSIARTTLECESCRALFSYDRARGTISLWRQG